MFRKHAEALGDILKRYLRETGIETPLYQTRLMSRWSDIVGETISRYTEDKYIKGETLFVKISNPGLKADLNMMRQQLVSKLNKAVGQNVITDIRFY